MTRFYSSSSMYTKGRWFSNRDFYFWAQYFYYSIFFPPYFVAERERDQQHLLFSIPANFCCVLVSNGIPPRSLTSVSKQAKQAGWRRVEVAAVAVVVALTSSEPPMRCLLACLLACVGGLAGRGGRGEALLVSRPRVARSLTHGRLFWLLIDNISLPLPLFDQVAKSIGTVSNQNGGCRRRRWIDRYHIESGFSGGSG